MQKILIRGGLGLVLIGRVRFRDILISYEILIRGGLGLVLIGRVRVRDILISYGNTDKILYEICDFAGGL